MTTHRIPLRSVTLCALLAAAGAASAQDAWDATIRGTEARTPAEEGAGFRLPPGFVMQLVASEPEISKPINMAFDARGRLWVSDTKEYPFPVADGVKGRDCIKVLEIDPASGRATRITTFADGLSIPLGVHPTGDGCIAYSTPAITFFHDTTGAGVCDRREQLYGTFGHDDTHGMTNSFTRGFDGWLYACHGFKNTSTVRGRDGQAITMTSGNTYRMRLDGSHVEQYTWGRVNPFGMSFDAAGDLYSSDCHTLPVYQLLRGGHYPGFGLPHDGLGYAPAMMSHMHGSTALCGVLNYSAEHFPAEYRGNCFTCNVVTSRIVRDTISFAGATPTAHEAADLVVSDDPWFRPVDLQLGPDGAIYVADFYNRIIGHYEVDLHHPQRDHERGRIWRITYRGDQPAAPLAPVRDLAHADSAALIAALADTNLAVRMHATDQLSDRMGAAAVPALVEAAGAGRPALQRAHALWTLHRLQRLDDALLGAAMGDGDAFVRRHALAMLAERTTPAAELLVRARQALRDADANVQRTAAEALGQHPDAANLRPLLDLIAEVPAADSHLLYMARKALRDQLLPAGALAAADAALRAAPDRARLAEVCLAIPDAAAADFLLANLDLPGLAAGDDLARLRHIARHLPPERLGEVAAKAQARLAGDPAAALGFLRSLRDARAERGLPADAANSAWAETLVGGILAAATGHPAWTRAPVDGLPVSADPWEVESRPCADGQAAPFLSSRQRGESLTGSVRSPAFAAPARLSFWLAGHNGPPGSADAGLDVVHLRDAQSHAVLMQALPPRQDVATEVVWDLATIAGRQVVLEAVDAQRGDGYAWLALGRISAPAPAVPGGDTALLKSAAELAKALRLASAAPALAQVSADDGIDPATRAIAVAALVAADGAGHRDALAGVLADERQPQAVREAIVDGLAGLNDGAADQALLGALGTANYRIQVRAASALAGTATGSTALLATVAAGKLSPRVLRERLVADRLAGADAGNVARIAELTRGLPPAGAERDQLIQERLAKYRGGTPSAEEGRKVFVATCTACHRMGGQGGSIGPQLDGIGQRGAERLLEDILDPSRNVDQAFRQSTLKLTDGRVLYGIIRRSEGQSLVIADMAGVETTIAAADVASRTQSLTSLMPDAFGQIIPADKLGDLVAYLVTQQGK